MHFTLQPPATRCIGVVVVHQIRRQVSSSVSFRPHQRHLEAVALKRVPRAHRKKKKNKTSGEVGRVASHVPIFLLFGLLSNEDSVSVDIISSCAYRSWGFTELSLPRFHHLFASSITRLRTVELSLPLVICENRGPAQVQIALRSIRKWSVLRCRFCVRLNSTG